jgi:hypothetical protein
VGKNTVGVREKLVFPEKLGSVGQVGQVGKTVEGVYKV